MYGPDDFSDATASHVSSLDFGDPFRKHEMRCRYVGEKHDYVSDTENIIVFDIVTREHV